MNVLLTGGSGFIGSHILDALISNNVNVKCLVREKSNTRWLKDKNISIIKTDFQNYELIKDNLKDIDIVIHVAGIIAALNYQHFYNVNTLGTKLLLESVSKYSNNFKKFIYMSSQTVGGPAHSLETPINELDKANPLTSYAKSKLEAESIIINNTAGINYTILRPSAVFGERDPGIVQIFSMVKKGFAPMMGMDKKYLNLIYAKDLANATINCIDNEKSDKQIYYIAGKEQFNWDLLMNEIKIAVNNPHAIKIKIPDPIVLSVGYINEKISQITRKSQIFNYDKAIDFTRKYWVCDSDKARQQISLQTNENIRDLFIKTATWYIENGWL
ncbi:MAG TPA: NAD-dependent epimerase/dehydratase family protein [Candidatus Kapabacteria bacterium]|nr:NAD-dependent epimerase/dehydratase family protein [Candidatus Kapabacteria bacterium]